VGLERVEVVGQRGQLVSHGERGAAYGKEKGHPVGAGIS
jgi:hypothetical protein